MNNVVTQLSEQLDAHTEQMLPICGKLVLYGDWDSPFLKSVRKKAEQFGVECGTHARRPLGVITLIESVMNFFAEQITFSN